MNYNSLFNTKKKRLLIIILILFLFLSIGFIYDRVYRIYHIGIPCVFHQITGLYCPGCGITRSIFSLLHLDLISAAHYNLIFIVFLPFLLYYLITNIINFILYARTYNVFSTKIWYLFCVIVIIFGVVRNFDCFAYLQPIN